MALLERFVAAGVAVTLAAGTATAVAGVADRPRVDRPRAAVTAYSGPLSWLPSATPSAAAGIASPAATGQASGHTVRRSAPVVQPLTALHEADFLVIADRRVSTADMQRLGAVSGVRALDLVDYGRITIAGHPATAIGVGPSTFRAYTPKLTASSDALWRSVAGGELTASFGMGHDAGLPLGQVVHVRGTRPMDLRIGAFASMLPGIDAVLARNESHGLGLPASNAVVVSAPGADPLKVQGALRGAMPSSSVQLLRKVIVIRDAGSFLDRRQINTVLQAAYTRIGAPYVWGATGPAAFDCSGLVGWAFRQAGIVLPRTSQQQWFAGPHVPLSSARPGDLLFWTYNPTDPSDVDHVAIYVGDGKMIVAPHTGDFVRVKPVPTAHLAGVVRVDPAMAAGVGGPHF